MEIIARTMFCCSSIKYNSRTREGGLKGIFGKEVPFKQEMWVWDEEVEVKETGSKVENGKEGLKRVR